MKTSEINIKVVTDINNLPELITWQASDSGMDGENETKAMMLAFWDSQNQNTLKIDSPKLKIRKQLIFRQ